MKKNRSKYLSFKIALLMALTVVVIPFILSCSSSNDNDNNSCKIDMQQKITGSDFTWRVYTTCKGTFNGLVCFEGGNESLCSADILDTPTDNSKQVIGLTDKFKVDFFLPAGATKANFVYCDNATLSLTTPHICSDGTTPKIMTKTIKTDGTDNECTYTYSDWTACINNIQARTYTSYPAGCTGTPVTTQSCTSAGYEGTWSGTFNYTAKWYPAPDYKEHIANGSFTLNMTLSNMVSAGGTQILYVTSVTSSDPAFGTTSSSTNPTSMATLPLPYNTTPASGEGIIITFPNGSFIGTTNDVAGAFTVSADGRTITSTAAVSSEAFTASTNVIDANTPGSGPGGYAYNWCTFTSWSLTKN